jgi:glycosyltransferase involved in cell wall biosynthesis
MNKGNLIYINDSRFSKSSGELSHTVGLLNALSKKSSILYPTHSQNKSLLKERGIDEKSINIRYFQTGPVKYLYKFLFYVLLSPLLLSNKKAVLYIRQSTFGLLLIPLLHICQFSKILVEINGISELEAKTELKRRLLTYIRKIYYALFKKKSTFICVSAGIQQYLTDKYAIHDSYVIENATDLSPRNQLEEGNEQIKNVNYLVFVGNISQWQDIDALIETVLHNLNYFIDHKLIINIYGDGYNKQRLIGCIDQHNVHGIINYHGTLSTKELCEVYPKAKAGLLMDTRIYKGLCLFSPLKYYEYSSFRLPTIYLVKKGTKIALENGIIIANPLNFVEKYEEAMKNRFSLPYIVRSWSSVVDEMTQFFIR